MIKEEVYTPTTPHLKYWFLKNFLIFYRPMESPFLNDHFMLEARDNNLILIEEAFEKAKPFGKKQLIKFLNRERRNALNHQNSEERCAIWNILVKRTNNNGARNLRF